jgi:hypothetical protein
MSKLSVHKRLLPKGGYTALSFLSENVGNSWAGFSLFLVAE